MLTDLAASTQCVSNEFVRPAYIMQATLTSLIVPGLYTHDSTPGRGSRLTPGGASRIGQIGSAIASRITKMPDQYLIRITLCSKNVSQIQISCFY